MQSMNLCFIVAPSESAHLLWWFHKLHNVRLCQEASGKLEDSFDVIGCEEIVGVEECIYKACILDGHRTMNRVKTTT